MNTVAYEENERNKRYFTFNRNPTGSYLIVDGSKATYRGIKVRDLSDREKRKFETLVMLTYLDIAKGSLLKVVLR